MSSELRVMGYGLWVSSYEFAHPNGHRTTQNIERETPKQSVLICGICGQKNSEQEVAGYGLLVTSLHTRIVNAKRKT